MKILPSIFVISLKETKMEEGITRASANYMLCADSLIAKTESGKHPVEMVIREPDEASVVNCRLV